MVPRQLLALEPVDRLIAGYVSFAAIVAVVRLGINGTSIALLVGYLLFGVLIVLLTRVRAAHRFGNIVHTIYPLLLTIPIYTAIGVVNSQLDPTVIPAHDALLQDWEMTIFGGQPSYDLIRTYPSLVASWVLHLAYFFFIPIAGAAPIFFLATGKQAEARRVILGIMISFVVCYVFFSIFPVSGPNWAFENPTGGVREVLPAKWVYSMLATGSAQGTAFPSSHVAATVASVSGAWAISRRLGKVLLLPAILLTVGTVYTQMHYTIDASAGLIVGLAGGWAGGRFAATQPPGNT